MKRYVEFVGLPGKVYLEGRKMKMYVCGECKALTLDKLDHLMWHKRMAETVRDVNSGKLEIPKDIEMHIKRVDV